MIKVHYDILYKNGSRDNQMIEVDSEEKGQQVAEVNDVIANAMLDGSNGYISLANGLDTLLVQLADISSVRITVTEQS